MLNVLVLDNVADVGVDILKKDFNVDIKNSMSEADLKEIIGKYDALVVRSQTKVSKEVIEASNLKVIGRAGVGVDNIDVEASTRKGVVVINSPDGNTIAAAEHTLALLFSLSRFIPSASTSLKQGEWKRKEFTGVELYNKTLGIIGLGRIGSHVAKVARAMGMKLIAFDPYINQVKAQELGIEVCDLERIYKEADFITIHVPLTSETNNLINTDSMKKMKKTVRIVNCSRGGIVNEKDLAEALENNLIGGAALDVFETEPLKESPLKAIQEKLIITPHLGASTQEAQINVAIDVAEQISAFLKGEKFKNAVNITGMNISEDLKPYLNLTDKLGSLLGQLTHESITKLEIKYLGEISEKDTKALTVSAIKGILSPILKDTVNYVNAVHIAKDRGISYQEINSSENTSYKSAVTLKAYFPNGEKVVSGTILNNEERIIQVDEYDLNFRPEGKLLFSKNIDKPGMVGKVGTVLGQNNINIANMDLGRNTSIKKSMMVISIDNNISDTVLSELKTMEGIIDIKVVNL